MRSRASTGAIVMYDARATAMPALAFVERRYGDLAPRGASASAGDFFGFPLVGRSCRLPQDLHHQPAFFVFGVGLLKAVEHTFDIGLRRTRLAQFSYFLFEVGEHRCEQLQ